MKNVLIILMTTLFITGSQNLSASAILNKTIDMQFAYLQQAKQMNLEQNRPDNGAMPNGMEDIFLQSEEQDEVTLHTSTGRDRAVVVMLTMEIFISLLIFIRLGFDYLKKH